ncbi:hypothetical protein CABS01_14481 [Colletotrichum abscissum]|uniref:Uncharacterized protein n=2 Tax=Colletotrichum acutatum species complex TaxID=2707335 RepID=A0A9Q0B4V4_9PEZI|nr:uncharacterized protein CTAM01_09090 [Colletotrichum tamarilloi]XP_060393329.1 uncharacterized protein CABS01_14481 [Colletotrichum abscissum]KAI3553323.1 hypothetical protein CABS02_06464 [Colletotrichum abscissum]KAK1480343.1 hypothetical protein CABS01_14481 [Colletotrichum abscissum]KAK1494209.1 hypothetical protein CTAM01_09090 [Colletotrichum tamarilloi]
MDALKNIANNVPDWLNRLDELGDQIDQRQVELAALGADSSSRSIKNRGSTESLKPKDEPANAIPPTDDELNAEKADAQRATGAKTPPQDEPKSNDQPSSPSSGTPSALKKQTEQAMALAQARARAIVEKRPRPNSVLSVEEGAPIKYRSRKLVMVYYDSYVQLFFEELVKFVSASRNLMRKAKMAAKVAQIRRLAEQELPEDEDGDKAGDLQPDTNTSASDALPSLRYMSTRRMGPGGRRGPSFTRAGQAGGGGAMMGDGGPDAYDELDKCLEYVQNQCEHAAHQFLRDGECSEEVGNIQRRLAETKELALKEMERVQKEEPELLKAASEANKVRTLRPTSMRRELTAAKDSNPPITPRKLEVDAKIEADTKTPVAKTIEVDMSKPLEADDGPIEADNDEGIDDMEITLPPRLNYRSTRAMRG